MVTIDTSKSTTATEAVLCGPGELGKEFIIELQRYGIEVIVSDKYPDAPAMQVAHRSYVVSMLDGNALRETIEREKSDYIVPEVEAIAIRTLMELEEEEYHVIPTARATRLTMNREGICRLAAGELGLPTSPYHFVETEERFKETVKVIDTPYAVKPIMSSSGHGQNVVHEEKDIDHARRYAQEGGRTGAGKVIVEGFVDFNYEITQPTVRHTGGTSFLEPIGHVQMGGNYRGSRQPQAMSLAAKAKTREIADKTTEALGGRDIFGMEPFIKGDNVIFSEVSPHPHGTRMVTMITQDLSQFALHARTVLDLPIPNIVFHGAGASHAVVVEGDSDRLSLGNLDKIPEQPDTQMRFFGKPEVHGHRRIAVLLTRDLNVMGIRGKTGVMMERLSVGL